MPLVCVPVDTVGTKGSFGPKRVTNLQEDRCT